LAGVRVLSRNNKHLYLSWETLKCIGVNSTGAIILEAFDKGATIAQVTKECARVYGIEDEEVMVRLLPFVNLMLEQGILKDEHSPKIKVDMSVGTGFPIKSLYVHVTDRCTHNCIYCYNAKSRKISQSSGIPELSREEILKLIREMKELGGTEIVFTGGEPLLRENLIEIAEEARKLDLKTLLLTNGVLITPHNATLLARTFDSITISLDSWIREEHEFQRGYGTFDPTIRGIKLMVQQGVSNVVIRIVVTERTVDSLPGFPKFGQDVLGCTKFLVQPYLPNSMAELSELNLFPQIDRYFSALADFSKRLEEVGGARILNEDTVSLSPKCGAGNRVFSVDARGNLYPCQALHHAEFCCGNIRFSSLRQLIEESPIMKIFQELNVSLIPHCNKCKLMLLCGGGCRAIAFNLYKKIDAYNEFLCPYLQREIEQRIWIASEKHSVV